MRGLIPALLLLAPCAAYAQSTPPLAPYVPPPTSSPLAPLPGTVPPGPPPDLTGAQANSSAAANIGAADTRSVIAPALPAPPSSGDTAHDYLAAARTALQSNQTGAAQEALERAESRLLDRDVAPSAANDVITGPLIHHIETARQSLSVGNTADALSAIDAALASPAPPGA